MKIEEEILNLIEKTRKNRRKAVTISIILLILFFLTTSVDILPSILLCCFFYFWGMATAYTSILNSAFQKEEIIKTKANLFCATIILVCMVLSEIFFFISNFGLIYLALMTAFAVAAFFSLCKYSEKLNREAEDWLKT